MKRLSFLFLLVLTACQSSGRQEKASVPKPQNGQKTALFAGGCFWGIQEGFSELKGVIKAVSGYAGGHLKNPTYQDVTSQTTGHAECVQVIYNPSVISFEQLLDAFFVIHDGTQLNKQGSDIGESYRSIVFYSNSEEKKAIETVIAKQNKTQLHPGKIVTEIKPMVVFYPVEKYHQDYFKTNPNSAYIQQICGPKVKKLREVFPNLLKEQY